MRNELKFTKAVAADEGAIRELLRTANLPYEDIHPHIDSFLVAKNSDELVGCVGLERAGVTALLRSLAVVPALRRRGIGKQLCRMLIDVARQHHVAELYLLTTDQAEFFEKQGFGKQPRESAPLAIQKTTQFEGLCPSSATLMSLSLRS